MSAVALVLAASGLCAHYAPPVVTGALDVAMIKEASGLAISRQLEGRYYHVNDSGDGPFVYYSRADGSDTRRFEVAGFAPQDVEDLGYGSCPDGSGQCLFVADVGDNDLSRADVTINVVRESEVFPEVVKPLRTLRITYPDGPHDLEGVALHPNGDLYLLSKEADYEADLARPARLFRVAAATWTAANTRVVAQDLGSLDIPLLAADLDIFGRIVTAFDIAPDGQRFIVLTYRVALEVAFDLSTVPLPPVAELVQGVDYGVVPLEELPQIEAVAYLPDGSGFVYDTEFHEGFGAPLLTARCHLLR